MHAIPYLDEQPACRGEQAAADGRESLTVKPRRAAPLRLAERSALLAVGDALGGALGALTAFVSWSAVIHKSVKWDVPASAAYGLGWVLALLLVHGYSALTPRSRLYSIVSVTKAAVPVSVMALIAFFLQPYLINRPSLLLSVATGVVLILLYRVTLARLLLHRVFATPTVVVAQMDVERDVREALESARFEYHILEWVIVPLEVGAARRTRELVDKALDCHQPSEILVGSMGSAQLNEVLGSTLLKGISVRKLSTLLEQYLARVPLAQVDTNWLLDLPSGHISERPVLFIKRCVDLLLASLLALPLFVFTPLIALAIRLDTSGPLYVRQKRLGQYGKEFTLLKFRTMQSDAEQGGAQWSRVSDPRITRVGRVLRPIRLDEWPQIVNVWRGEMSFIGPRPERPEFVAVLESELPHYRARLLVKPGLTGWAQVKAGYASSVADSGTKLEFDLYYVKYRGLRLDMQVLMLTLFVVLGFSGR